MAIVFMDGFDCYADVNEAFSAGWSRESNTNATLSTTAGINSGGALQCTSTAQAGWTHAVIAPATATTTWPIIVAFWVNFTALPAGDDEFFAWNASDNMSAKIHIFSTGQLKVYYANGNTSTTADETSTGIITAGTWHYVEFKMTFGSDTTGSYTLKVDENTVVTNSSLDTKDGSDLPDNFVFRPGDGTTVYYDDVIVMDNAGGAFDDFQGKLYIETLNVDADGGTVAWTRNTGATDVSAVDDTANAADDDTTYVDSQTATEETRFGIPEPSDSDDPIKAVQIRARLTKTDAGTRTVRGLMNVNAGTEEITFDEIGVAEGWGWYALGIRATNDTGGTAWDATNVGLTEIGLEIVL